MGNPRILEFFSLGLKSLNNLYLKEAMSTDPSVDIHLQNNVNYFTFSDTDHCVCLKV